MKGGRLVVVVLAGMIAIPSASAQPAEADPEREPEIEMGGDPPADAPLTKRVPDGLESPDSPEAPTAPPPVVKDPALAKKLAQVAVTLVRKGDYMARRKKPDEARGLYADAANAYQKALEIGDDLNLNYDLALVEEKLGKPERAVKYLRIVVNAETGIRPDVLKKATAKHDELGMLVGIVRLVIDPEGASVSLGETQIGLSPLAEPLILAPGDYTVTLAAAGYQPKDLELKVEAGSEAERTIELEPIKLVVAPVIEKPDEPIAPAPVPAPPNRLPMYVGAGVGGVALLTGVITGIAAVSKHGTFTGAGSTRTEREDAQSSGKALALVSDLSLGTAVVAGAFTAYWYWFKYRPAQAKLTEQEPPRGIAKVQVVPWVQPNSAISGRGVTSGLGVSGSF